MIKGIKSIKCRVQEAIYTQRIDSTREQELNAFKKYCNDNQIVCKDLLKQFEKSKIFMGEVRKRMSKGTQVTTPAVYAYQFTFADQDVFGAESLTENLDDFRRGD